MISSGNLGVLWLLCCDAMWVVAFALTVNLGSIRIVVRKACNGKIS
jgi:hypothetical protein